MVDSQRWFAQVTGSFATLGSGSNLDHRGPVTVRTKASNSTRCSRRPRDRRATHRHCYTPPNSFSSPPWTTQIVFSFFTTLLVKISRSYGESLRFITRNSPPSTRSGCERPRTTARPQNKWAVCLCDIMIDKLSNEHFRYLFAVQILATSTPKLEPLGR